MSSLTVIATSPLEEGVPECPHCRVTLGPGEMVYTRAQVELQEQVRNCKHDYKTKIPGEPFSGIVCNKCREAELQSLQPMAALRQCPKCFLLWRLEPKGEGE